MMTKLLKEKKVESRITIQKEPNNQWNVYDFDGVELLGSFSNEKDAIAFAMKKNEELNSTNDTKVTDNAG